MKHLTGLMLQLILFQPCILLGYLSRFFHICNQDCFFFFCSPKELGVARVSNPSAVYLPQLSPFLALYIYMQVFLFAIAGNASQQGICKVRSERDLQYLHKDFKFRLSKLCDSLDFSHAEKGPKYPNIS